MGAKWRQVSFDQTKHSFCISTSFAICTIVFWSDSDRVLHTFYFARQTHPSHQIPRSPADLTMQGKDLVILVLNPVQRRNQREPIQSPKVRKPGSETKSTRTYTVTEGTQTRYRDEINENLYSQRTYVSPVQRQNQ